LSGVFTGIVEATGVVSLVNTSAAGRRIRFRAPDVIEGLTVGRSVAVDGACLTAVELHPDGFSVDVIGTTLERTVAGGYREGVQVNLERGLRLGDPLDGHMVQGHVDGIGEVLAVCSDGDRCLVDVRFPPEVEAVTILYGSITLNGVSLTVNALPGPGSCQVALIPHTRVVTTLGSLRTGDAVNLEVDLIGKYVGRILASQRAAPGRSPDPASPDP
jgi:riboflavin synthase